ncbi:hypothetical protein N9383_02755 [Granulosicoccus sp.]|nr:hypothetical protein [Granulosicoccus sp.]
MTQTCNGFSATHSPIASGAETPITPMLKNDISTIGDVSDIIRKTMIDPLIQSTIATAAKRPVDHGTLDGDVAITTPASPISPAIQR